MEILVEVAFEAVEAAPRTRMNFRLRRFIVCLRVYYVVRLMYVTTPLIFGELTKIAVVAGAESRRSKSFCGQMVRYLHVEGRKC
jgi:hypothetical protein